MKTKHTQGEWRLFTIDGGEGDDEICTYVNGCLVNIANVFGACEFSEATIDGKNKTHYKVSWEEAVANGLVLAAASKLLEALQTAYNYQQVDGARQPWMDLAEVAIAKATSQKVNHFR